MRDSKYEDFGCLGNNSIILQRFSRLSLGDNWNK